MRTGLRAGVLGATSAALVAGSLWGASSASGAPSAPRATRVLPTIGVVFKAEHIRGVKGPVLVAGRGLVVYTFTGDKHGKPGTCTGPCAAIWPAVRGMPIVARGVKIRGKFGAIHGQITFNGWPLYVFTGENVRQSHATGSFKVVAVKP